MTDVLARNNVRVIGHGRQPILFAHGFGCDQNMWRFVAPAFEADYRVVLFDYVGSGKSDLRAFQPQRYSDLRGYAQDVLDICEALDLQDLIFVGHSVSSTIGMLAAIQAPQRFAQLLCLVPSACYVNDPPQYIGGFERADIEGLLELMDKNFIGWARGLAPVIMGNPDRPELTQELGDSFCSTDPVTARCFAQATFLADNRADIAQLRTPTLLLECQEDPIAPPTAVAFLHQTLPRSTWWKMQATGHCPHMSHPEETITVLKRYLSEVATADQRQSA